MLPSDLPEPWREVFSQMWEAYEAGAIPVGAVVVNGDGIIVARGRNRMFEAPSDESFAQSRIAHAEVNAIIGLTSERTYEDHTLYTALEPCHLCLSAAITARIGAVLYAASDPYSGAAGKLMPSRDHEVHPIALDGPLAGEAGRIPQLLLVAHSLWRRPNGDVVAFYRETSPDVVKRAQRLPPPQTGGSLDDAFEQAPAR